MKNDSSQPTSRKRRAVRLIAIFLVGVVSSCTPSIHDAALRADVERVASLLDADPALVNTTAGRGKTPLHQGVTSGREQTDAVVTLLLERGADPNARDVTGMTPLHVAASWTTRHRAGLLINSGAEVNARDALGNTPLHEAVLHGRVAMTHFLLESGSDPTLENRLGETPLDLAKKGGFERIVGLLQDRLGAV